MNKEKITEDMNLEKLWFEEARKVSLEELPNFINHLLNDYQHDYGTIVHAVSACAIASAWVAADQAGITGFQASFVMWDFIRNWMSLEGTLKLVQYDQMLFPQYEDKFEKKIDEDTFKELQEKAKKMLSESNPFLSPTVKEHWQSIIDGNVPFGYKLIKNEKSEVTE